MRFQKIGLTTVVLCTVGIQQSFSIDIVTKEKPNIVFILFFLSIAAVYARELGINHIVTGVSQTDFSGYPDCRDAFIKSLNVTLNLAMDEQFVLHTPLMWIDKAETWALADELGVLDLIRHETLTCYNGVQGDGCGHCPACKLRREGLEKYLEIKAEREKC